VAGKLFHARDAATGNAAHGLQVTTDEWMEQAAWVWRQSAGSSDRRR